MALVPVEKAPRLTHLRGRQAGIWEPHKGTGSTQTGGTHMPSHWPGCGDRCVLFLCIYFTRVKALYIFGDQPLPTVTSLI